MLRKNPSGHYPQVSTSAYIDKTAIILWQCDYWRTTFLLALMQLFAPMKWTKTERWSLLLSAAIPIFRMASVIHSKAGARVTVGSRTSIAHRSIIHGPCSVGDNVFIGFNSVVFRTDIGDGCVVRHNCVVDGTDIPAGTVIPPVVHIGPEYDLATLPQTDQSASDFSESIISANHYLVKGYKQLANEF